ncbi:MAG: hypothetical protein QOJ94_210 [Sphingomonadales bacterium]|jgi:uncharacterized membrane protein YidH (DUF202 family)|nr:hypothetical protein [Sphingomonadales bacterium]
MALVPPPEPRTFTKGEIAFAFAGVALLVLVAVALTYVSWPNGSGGSETFRFITLLVIVVATLTAAAGVFVWLQMQNQSEAFGLPSGSIRAVLAIAVMVLFVVFGLPAVSPLPASEARLTTAPVSSIVVPTANADQWVTLHRNEGLTVIVKDYDKPAGSTRIEIYGKVKIRSADELELAKQVLTALLSALTMMIGFYFGGRSTNDAAAAVSKAVQEATAAAAPKTG